MREHRTGGAHAALAVGRIAHAGDECSASSRLLIIGQMMPSAPPSSAFMMSPGAFHGTRTIGVTGAAFIACSMGASAS